MHQIRNSLRFVNWIERKAVAADLKTIYGAATLQQAEQALEQFAKKWTMPLRDWKPAMTQFIIMYGDRVSL